MTVFTALRGLNQGHAIVAGWNNQATLKDITAYQGTDGKNFLPVNDRNGYTPGVTRQLTTGGTRASGMPVVRFTSPWISDGQLDYLTNTLLSGSPSGNVTVRYHRYDSVGRTDTFVANGILNLNLEQLPNLQRRQNGYLAFEWQIVITETL